jgi:UDP-glucuronate 4-epimerase
VLASSSSVYGGNEKTPFAETDPVEHPISPYAASKRALELLAWTDWDLHGGDIACLRFFTVYGERQRPEMAIHKFMRIMHQGETIPMFGDGTTGRDYTYIGDIVDGVLRTIDRIEGYRIYNLGGDEVILLRDLIAAIGEVTGIEPKVEQLPMQPGDVLVTNADLTRARAELGYEPQTTLRKGLENMWAWYLEEVAG